MKVESSYKTRIKFEQADHKYFVDGELYPSASKLISEVYEPFDVENISARVAASTGVSQQEVKDEWEATNRFAIEKGNALHNLGEQIGLLSKSGMSEVVSMIHFWSYLFSMHAVVLEMEQPVFSEEFGFAGTPDLLVNQYDEFGEQKTYIYDYKTNKNIYKNYKGKRLLAPFDYMLDSPETHYYIQQNLYMLALKEHGVHVDGAILVWLREKEFELIEVPIIDLTPWLQSRRIFQP